MAKKGIIKLKIQAYDDREKMVMALANSGYAVWVEEKVRLMHDTDYYVCFEQALKA